MRWSVAGQIVRGTAGEVEHINFGVGDFILARVGTCLGVYRAQEILEQGSAQPPIIRGQRLYWPEESHKGRQRKMDGKHELMLCGRGTLHQFSASLVLQVCQVLSYAEHKENNVWKPHRAALARQFEQAKAGTDWFHKVSSDPAGLGEAAALCVDYSPTDLAGLLRRQVTMHQLELSEKRVFWCRREWPLGGRLNSAGASYFSMRQQLEDVYSTGDKSSGDARPAGMDVVQSQPGLDDWDLWEESQPTGSQNDEIKHKAGDLSQANLQDARTAATESRQPVNAAVQLEDADDWDDFRCIFVQNSPPDNSAALRNSSGVQLSYSSAPGHANNAGTTPSSAIKQPSAATPSNSQPMLAQVRPSPCMPKPSASPKVPWLKTPSPQQHSLGKRKRIERGSNWLTPSLAPPTAAELQASLQKYGLPNVVYQPIHYSNARDVPPPGIIQASGVPVCRTTLTVNNLEQFSPPLLPEAAPATHRNGISTAPSAQFWCASTAAPTVPSVVEWLRQEKLAKAEAKSRKASLRRADTITRLHGVSQIEGCSHPQTDSRSEVHSGTSKVLSDNLTILSLEVFAVSRGALLPNPAHDAIHIVCYSISIDAEDAEQPPACIHGAIMVAPEGHEYNSTKIWLETVASEEDLFYAITRTIRKFDPDIITGYDVQRSSWGFVLKRAKHLGLALEGNELARTFSRVPFHRSAQEAQPHAYNQANSCDIVVIGRVTINLWRVVRADMQHMRQYSFETACLQLLRRRVPRYSARALTAMFQAAGRDRQRCLDYFATRAAANLELMEHLDVINKCTEHARVMGIDFESVLTRGSQFRVESILYRLSKLKGYLLVSATKPQVASQHALEVLPLVMEPQSNMYTSPVIVLDFRSLYPSIVIAYNICYSTCLGTLQDATEAVKRLGVLGDVVIQPTMIKTLLEQEQILVTPNGLLFAKEEARRGILPRMLREIIDTRFMIKKVAKEAAKRGASKRRLRSLDARQLSLKLLANTTYGYASASFSGRMPCVEIADAIVSTARQTLEDAMMTVSSNPEWGAEVVYGDTDSLFVHLEGRTLAQAFEIGKQIAETVSKVCPAPVKLQLEKVYLPCVLITKKRYVGFKFDNPSQVNPDFDAKGIETVRRDGCPAVSKMMEKMIRLLFNTKDISQVRQYLTKQWSKILSGRVSLPDFVFAKEVRLGTYSNKGMLPPAAIVATKSMVVDPCAEPEHGERVAYVVVCGAPGARLSDLVVSPAEFISRPELRLNSHYYLTKQIIPALNRILTLVGVDAMLWLEGMDRPAAGWGCLGPNAAAADKRTVDQYFLKSSCLVCNTAIRAGTVFCAGCMQQPMRTHLIFQSRKRNFQQQRDEFLTVCMQCTGAPTDCAALTCESFDCPVFIERTKVLRICVEFKLLDDLVRQRHQLAMDLSW